MSVPPKVLELVDLFRRNAEAYHAAQYNEAMVRQEFINPLFKCLGWDMDNEQGYAEAYKDVIHEAAIKIGGATRAPDYCFRIGGAAKFFLEAKRPSVSIKDDPAPAYQLRRYAWTAKLPLSILTDFEEFAVYDCRIKPTHTDKAGVARVLYLRYEDYTDRWEDIAGRFSREAILKGSFDKFAESNKAKRGTATKMTQEKSVLQRHIVATDRQIGRLVNDLYGLTNNEISIASPAIRDSCTQAALNRIERMPRIIPKKAIHKLIVIHKYFFRATAATVWI